MSSFRDQSFEQRFEKMGDEAEGRFEVYAADKLQRGFIRFGLNRPPLKMSELPTRLRYTPDYLMGRRFVEVQGLGRDQTMKVKIDKLNCAHYWNDLHPFWWYLWDRTNERECMFHLFVLDQLINESKAEIGHFAEGKAYFAFKADDVFDAAVGADA